MNLISKKDLLAITGISYGQLYRWKREGLIPEEWFIKRPSYTGQETFFPREQVISRVQSILEAKGRYSLEELARIFSPESQENAIPLRQAAALELLDVRIKPLLTQPSYTLQELVLLAALSQAQLPQQDALLLELVGHAMHLASSLSTFEMVLTVFYTEDTPRLLLTRATPPVAFDGSIQVQASIALSELSGRLKVACKTQLTDD